MNINTLQVSLLFFLLYFFLPLQDIQAQDTFLFGKTPQVGVKANVLSYASTTLQLGGEMKLQDEWTLDLSLSYNPWSFSGNKKMKHLLVQPEICYWLCEAFNGTFLGLHAHYGLFNVGGIGLSDFMKEHRHEGWLLGGGISVGYQWVFSGRWSLEATIGLGYAYLDYERYPCEKCGDKLADKSMHYLGPTRLGLSVVYIIK